MGRPVILGNGSLTVGLNEAGMVHDFYYPYVGLDNLTTARSMHHKIGIYVNGSFSWLDDGSWQTTVDFEQDALVSNINLQNNALQIRVEFSDFVDSAVNAFCRRITVHNLADQQRAIKLFMHQVFQISRGGRGDTALFVPNGNYILDYKGRCSLLIFAQSGSHNTLFDQYCVGNYGIEGKEGTWRDAEDGELAGNAVEHGGVDSVLRMSFEIGAAESQTADYWVVAGDSQFAAEKTHHRILADGLQRRLDKTRKHWYEWLDTARDEMNGMSEGERVMIKKSLMVIKAHTDKRGGIIASCDSSIYNYGRDYYSYVWPRDGAFAMWPLIRLGYTEEPKKFFEFCRDILHPDGYLLHKYQPDRAIGSTWHPLVHGRHTELAIQEDETAIVLYMLGELYEESGDKEYASSLYITLIQPAANFLAQFRDDQTGLPHATYDLWEEKFATHTYTVAVTYQALLTAAQFADLFEYPDDAVTWRAAAAEIAKGVQLLFDPERQAFRKSFLLQEDGSLQFDNTLDISSLFAVSTFGPKEFGKQHITDTLKLAENVLLDKSPAGGAPRYEHDTYFASDPPHMGNPWFVTTLWMAQYYIQHGDKQKGKQLIDWTISKALPSGVLSEQINPETGSPLSVTPLVWSHAELINTLLDYHASSK